MTLTGPEKTESEYNNLYGSAFLNYKATIKPDAYANIYSRRNDAKREGD
jgi:hypothetical protein